MTREGFAAFLSMGGYGFYVWTSYIVVALALIIEIIAVRARSRAAIGSTAKSKRMRPPADDAR
jgi:heme exporter protein CcmD